MIPRHDIETAERNCLRSAPPRSIGRRAAVLYLAHRNALWKLDTPVPILRPTKNPRPQENRLTLPGFLIWNRGVPSRHREL